jgi:hypothetical protein
MVNKQLYSHHLYERFSNNIKIIDYKIKYPIPNNTINTDTDAIAVIIIGELRSFFELIEQFKIFIQDLKKSAKKIVIFFYISTEVSYTFRINEKTTQERQILYKISFDDFIKKFESEIKDIECVYKRKEKKYSLHSHISQLYDINIIHQLLYDYEIKNEMEFNYIIKTRPDMYYNNTSKVDLSNYFGNCIYLLWDMVYIYPRWFSVLFDQYITYIDSVDHIIMFNKISDVIFENTNDNFKNINEKDAYNYIYHFSFFITTLYLNLNYRQIQDATFSLNH